MIIIKIVNGASEFFAADLRAVKLDLWSHLPCTLESSDQQPNFDLPSHIRSHGHSFVSRRFAAILAHEYPTPARDLRRSQVKFEEQSESLTVT